MSAVSIEKSLTLIQTVLGQLLMQSSLDVSPEYFKLIQQVMDAAKKLQTSKVNSKEVLSPLGLLFLKHKTEEQNLLASLCFFVIQALQDIRNMIDNSEQISGFRIEQVLRKTADFILALNDFRGLDLQLDASILDKIDTNELAPTSLSFAH